MYSIDQNILSPPQSVLVGLLLVYSLYVIGKTAFKILRPVIVDGVYSSAPVSIVFGASVISALLSPLVVLQLASRTNLKIFASILLGVSLLHVFVNWRSLVANLSSAVTNLRNALSSSDFPKVLTALIYGLYFLASLGAVNNADSLDYHLGAAISILNNNGLFYQPEWIHGRLSGSQEYLNALGLAAGSEQFGSIIQFFSFAAIAVTLNAFRKRRQKESTKQERRSSDYLFLSLISTPVFIFLVTSSKPDLWGMALTTIALALIIDMFVLKADGKDVKFFYSVIAILAFSAYAAKFKFILSAATIILLLLYFAYKRNQLLPAIAAIISVALCIAVPSIIFKLEVYNATVFEVLTSPIPRNTPGIDEWLSRASQAGDINSGLPYPISLVVPDSFGNLTGVLGLSFLIVVSAALGVHRGPRRAISFACYGLLAATMLLAPPGARHILEPIIWICLLVFTYGKFRAFVTTRWYAALVITQALASVAIAFVGVLMFFPGALSSELRKEVLRESANGYTMMEWVDSIAPADAVILSTHRSMALLPRKSVSYDWHVVIHNNESVKRYYMQRINEIKVTHVLLNVDPENISSLRRCIDTVVKGHNVNRYATRNPFNRSTGRGDAWLVKLNKNGLDNCEMQP